MVTWFGPSENYWGLERRYQNTEVITEYCIVGKSLDKHDFNNWLMEITKQGNSNEVLNNVEDKAGLENI